MTTEGQAENNRRNAEASTGPTTEEGKRASRVNALKLGLSGRGLILPQNEAGLASERKERLRATLALEGADVWSEILLEQVAVESVRLERCQQEERLVRERMAAEAAALWDEDRALEAVQLGGAIARDPESIRLKLERTLQGVDWLIGRWRLLRKAFEMQGEWTQAQGQLVAHLLGIAGDEFAGRSGSSRETGLALADREIERLEALKPSRVGMDERDRNLAEVGISPETERRLKTLRRYEAASRRAMEQGMAELRRHRGVNESASPAKADHRPAVAMKPAEYETKPMAADTEAQGRVVTAGRLSNPLVNPPFPTPHLPHGLPGMNLRDGQPRNRRQRRAVESILRRG